MDKEEKQRTLPQNRSLHMYLDKIAELLWSSGQDMRKVIKVPIKPTMENVKELMFKPYMNAMYPDIESTADLSTEQMQEVYEAFNAAIADKLEVSAEWPSRDSQINESLIK